MFDAVHNNVDKRDFAELVCEVIIYAQNCEPCEIEGLSRKNPIDVSTIVHRVGCAISSIARYPRLPILGDFQFSDNINAVMHRLIYKRVSKNDSINKLLTLLEEIGWAMDSVPEESIERAVSFLEEGDKRRAYNAIRAVF